MTDTIIITMVTTAVSSLVGLAVGFLWKSVINIGKENKAIKSALMILLKGQIANMYERYVEFKGFMPIKMKDLLASIFTIYKSLGGNGVAEQMYEEMLDLPTTAPKVAKTRK